MFLWGNRWTLIVGEQGEVWLRLYITVSQPAIRVADFVRETDCQCCTLTDLTLAFKAASRKMPVASMSAKGIGSDTLHLRPFFLIFVGRQFSLWLASQPHTDGTRPSFPSINIFLFLSAIDYYYSCFTTGIIETLITLAGNSYMLFDFTDAVREGCRDF